MTRERLPCPSLVLLLASLTACGGGAAATARPPSRGLSVTVAPVAAQDVVYQIKAVGSLEAEETVQVTAQVEGAVTDVLFHEGDRVGAATVLARIDPERYRLESDRAQAAWRQAVAEQHRAESDLARREQLAGQQLLAAEELNRARQDAERLGAQAAEARAAADIAAQNRARAELRAPHAGVINTKAVEPGQYVKVGTVLATLVDTGRLRLRFKVSEGESLKVRSGQTVSLRVAALGERTFPATVYHVGEMADPTTRQVEVLSWVRNPGELKPGFFAEVTLPAESRASALVVPEGAVQASEKGFVVYVVDGGTARLRPVQVGLRTGTGIVEIVSGLKGGDLVVTEGSDRLVDGIAVTPVAKGGAK